MVVHLVCNKLFHYLFLLTKIVLSDIQRQNIYQVMVPRKILSLAVASLLKLIHLCTSNVTLWEARLYTHLKHSDEIYSWNVLSVLVELDYLSADYWWCAWPVCVCHMDIYGCDINFICVPLILNTTSMICLLYHFLPNFFFKTTRMQSSPVYIRLVGLYFIVLSLNT